MGINRSYELHCTRMKENDFSGCHCHPVHCVYQWVIGTKFRLSVYAGPDGSMASSRSSGEISSMVGKRQVGWGGHPHRAVDLGNQPSIFVSGPAQGRGKRRGQKEKLQGRRLLIWRHCSATSTSCWQRHTSILNFYLKRWIRSQMYVGYVSHCLLNDVLLIFILVVDIGGVICRQKVVEVKDEEEPVEELKKKDVVERRKQSLKQYNDVSSDFIVFPAWLSSRLCTCLWLSYTVDAL